MEHCEYWKRTVWNMLKTECLIKMNIPSLSNFDFGVFFYGENLWKYAQKISRLHLRASKSQQCSGGGGDAPIPPTTSTLRISANFSSSHSHAWIVPRRFLSSALIDTSVSYLSEMTSTVSPSANAEVIHFWRPSRDLQMFQFQLWKLVSAHRPYDQWKHLW